MRAPRFPVNTVIELRNVEKFYETRAGQTFVLRRISLYIKEGDFLTIMGPSGAGKSTLLAILGMLDSNWTGEYYFLGGAVHQLKPRDRVELNKRYIGFVFQQYHLLDDLTVYENLDIPLSYRNIKRSERQAIVADTLDRFQIVARADLWVANSQLSQNRALSLSCYDAACAISRFSWFLSLQLFSVWLHGELLNSVQFHGIYGFGRMPHA